MTTGFSMTRRLIVRLTAAIALFWIGAVGISAYVMREEFNEVFDSSLQEASQRLMPLLIENLVKDDTLDEPRRISSAGDDSEEYLTYQLRNRDGKVLLHSHDAEPEPFPAPLQPGFFDTPTHRIFTESAVTNTLFLQVADPLSHRREAMRETAGALFLPLLALIPLSIVLIWLVTRLALAPIGALRMEISARDGGNLEPLPATGLPSELLPISVSVDRLLGRVRTALEGERAFASNSAHELRTPLAGALAQTQRLVQELPKGPARVRALGIERSLSSLGHLAEKLLQLSRADSGIGLSQQATDLLPVIRLIVHDFARQPDFAGRLELQTGDLAEFSAQVDVDAFGITMRNLIENALLHGSKDQPIKITVSPEGAVSVVNAGPIVPQDELIDLTGRFKRGSTDALGSGLGLAIASSLVDHMGGKLTLNSPAHGLRDGFQATFSIPMNVG
ncbi:MULTISPECIES: sensor histidine kinase [Mesorhizobium]|uniref:histidine kinase n=1 Tax=Mesorhizobium denitrificans TaxID=2294114 RepID=A0A371XED7_9HYPH|nr:MULTISPECIES: ATP-binding protein [Mesorhizobium]RFC67601.1 two-component sensor histidine kinase [Mesorhizobium denitrificans]